MAQRSPTETTTTFAATVDTLSDAWAFVMEHVDAVGPEPRITIGPLSSISVADMDRQDDGPWEHYFEVSVSGMVEHPIGADQ